MGKIAAVKLVDFYIVILILFISGITILGVFSPFFDPRNHTVIPYIGLLLPPLLVINIINCIYSVMTKRYILMGIVVLSFIFGFWGAGYKFSNFFNSSEDTLGYKNIRVMTFNIGENNKGNNSLENLKQVIQFIKSQDIDVLCIQEYPTNNETDELLKQYLNFMPFYTFTENSNQYLRVAIFSRFPILNIKHFLFQDSRNSAISAHLKINDKVIKLLCAHLQTTNYNQRHIHSIYTISNTIYQTITKMNENRKLRAQQADLLKEEIESNSLPLIFCGDINDTPASYTYRQISKNLKDGFKECGSGVGYTYRGFSKLLRIDHILYSDEFSGIRYWSPDRDFSDHNPVIMDLVLH